MTLREKQLELCAILNADEALRLGGCIAMAEDSLAIGAELEKQLQTIKGVAIVVMTPSCNRIGGSVPGCIPVEIPELTISCVEMPDSRKPGRKTALEAAQDVAFIFDTPKCCFKSILQSTDEGTGCLLANAVFSTTMMLTRKTTQK